MDASFYIDGSYLDLHPSWHVEDSQWKASQVLRLLKRNALEVTTVTEIGCGAGEVLALLQDAMPPSCRFRGYELSPDAYLMCQPRANRRLEFFLQSLEKDTVNTGDLILALDVLEHTEDYFSFLRMLHSQAEHCILHVPLDLSVQSLLWGLPQRVRKTAGHLHYFTAPILLSAVSECGFEVMDAMYTRPSIEREPDSFRGRAARYPRLVAANLSEKWAALMLGGFSMMILAKRK